MHTYLFVSTLDNVINKVQEYDEDSAWRKYIRYYFSHRLKWGETSKDIRKELEHDIFVVDEGMIPEIGA